MLSTLEQQILAWLAQVAPALVFLLARLLGERLKYTATLGGLQSLWPI